MQTLSLRKGTTGTWTVTIANEGGPVTTYTSGATLQAIIWSGDDQAALATLTPTWLDPSAGTITLTIGASDIASLSPQIYTLSLTITASGVTREGFRCWLSIDAAPGSATAPLVFCTYDDMLRFASWLDTLQNESDTAGFQEQRARATQWVIEQAMARARDMLEDQYKRHAPLPLNTTPQWVQPTGGVDLGYRRGVMTSYWQPDILADMTTWRAWLNDTSMIVVDSRLVEITAKRAISFACAQQLGAIQQTSYQTLAVQFRQQAICDLAGYIFRILTPSDTDHPERKLD
jgi:hypothetical protein